MKGAAGPGPPVRSMEIVPSTAMELALWRAGLPFVAGLDEVGRGPLAGPVVAGAVVLPPFSALSWLGDVRDSKLLSPPRRDELAEVIRRDALAWGVAAASAADIDRWGIVTATHRAMDGALALLAVRPHFLLLDALVLPDQSFDQIGLIDGDALCVSIACASILAKVARDQLMTQSDTVYPGYGFARHKGYGTAEHLRALARLGPSPLHRRSFGARGFQRSVDTQGADWG